LVNPAGFVRATAASSILTAFALILTGCISTPTSFTRDAPAAVYPTGELSGESTRVFGWRLKF